MGAGGNLGTIGIQIAKNVIGARVIAAAGSDERVKLGNKARRRSRHQLQRPTDILDEIMKFTDGKGVDVLYDNIANPAVLPLAFLAIGMDGRLVTAGAHAGPHVADRFLAPLPQAHHHQGHARLHALRPAALPRRGGARQSHSADRARLAAVAGRRGTSLGREATRARARSCSIPTLG